MHFNEYQNAAAKTASYPQRGTVVGLMYTALGRTGEGGELANKIKKMFRDGLSVEDVRDFVKKELGDWLRYVAETASNSAFLSTKWRRKMSPNGLPAKREECLAASGTIGSRVFALECKKGRVLSCLMALR